MKWGKALIPLLAHGRLYWQARGIIKFKSRLGVAKFSRWEIKRGRSTEDINRIMLAMMMNAASRFEGLQSLRSFSWCTDSGFSGENLVSDLFGFYRAIIPDRYGYRLKPVSYDPAQRSNTNCRCAVQGKFLAPLYQAVVKKATVCVSRRVCFSSAFAAMTAC